MPAVRGAGHHHRANAERAQFTHQCGRIRAGRIAEGNQPGKQHRLGGSRRDRQNTATLLLKRARHRRRGRLRPDEGGDHGKGTFDHALRGAGRVRQSPEC
jgi:hypothetical protein